MKRLSQLLALVLIMNSCLMTSGRSDLIERDSELELPNDFLVLQDTVETFGFAGSDYTITVELQFDSLNFEQLIKSIPKNSEEWKESKRTFKYYRDLSSSNSVSITIDPTSRRLVYKQHEI